MGNQGVTNILFYMFILLISAFVIANTTIMVVSKRRREIGILMTMGSKRRSILMISLLENMLIIALAFALSLCFVSGLYPAYSAAQLDPVEAIGSE